MRAPVVAQLLIKNGIRELNKDDRRRPMVAGLLQYLTTYNLYSAIHIFVQ